MWEDIFGLALLAAIGYGLYRYAQYRQAKKEAGKLGGGFAAPRDDSADN